MESAGLRAAPVFRPSEREFADPLSYIESIRPAAEQHGLCRVVPPPGFKVRLVADHPAPEAARLFCFVCVYVMDAYRLNKFLVIFQSL